MLVYSVASARGWRQIRNCRYRKGNQYYIRPVLQHKTGLRKLLPVSVYTSLVIILLNLMLFSVLLYVYVHNLLFTDQRNWSYHIKSMATSPMMTATVTMDFITISMVACSYHAMRGDADVAGTSPSSPLLPLPFAIRLRNSLMSAKR